MLLYTAAVDRKLPLYTSEFTCEVYYPADWRYTCTTQSGRPKANVLRTMTSDRTTSSANLYGTEMWRNESGILATVQSGVPVSGETVYNSVNQWGTNVSHLSRVRPVHSGVGGRPLSWDVKLHDFLSDSPWSYTFGLCLESSEVSAAYEFLYGFSQKPLENNRASKPHRRNLCPTRRTIAFGLAMILIFDLWPWKPVQRCPLTWWVSVANFVEISPLSTEIARHAKQLLTDRRTTERRPQKIDMLLQQIAESYLLAQWVNAALLLAAAA